MKFEEHDRILAAYAENAQGPGWANQPVWCVVRSCLDGSVRMECLQPSEQSSDVMKLYRISEVAHKAMTDAVRAHLESKRRKRKTA